jgi:hypothetical protein
VKPWVLSYDEWWHSSGRCYVSDGHSHLIDFKANGVNVGEGQSELRLDGGGSVKLSARVAARLDEKPAPDLRGVGADKKPYWHIERARIDGTREVPVEVIVNGESVAQQRLLADGTLRDISFDVPITRSSWVALRIRASSHRIPCPRRNKPVRASRRASIVSRRGPVLVTKRRFIAGAELPAARKRCHDAMLPRTTRGMRAQTDLETYCAWARRAETEPRLV